MSGFNPNPDRTQSVLAAIVDLTAGGLPTTVREIQQHCRISSTSVAVYHIRKLEVAGKIVRDDAISRSIRPAGNWWITAEQRAAIRVALETADLDGETRRTLQRMAA